MKSNYVFKPTAEPVTSPDPTLPPRRLNTALGFIWLIVRPGIFRVCCWLYQ